MSSERTDLEIVPFERTHLEPAACLFSIRYEAQRALVPFLPRRYGDPAEVLPLLRGLTSTYPGVVALDRGVLAGYLAGMFLPSLKGSERGVYCPEWGHAVGGHNPRLVYELMYASISNRWVADGCLNQALTILAGDREAVDAWFWFGFGMIVVDAVGEADAIAGRPSATGVGVNVREAVTGDGQRLLPIMREHTRYYPAGPVFLPKPEVRDAAEVERDLANPRIRLWVAEDPQGEVVGIIKGELEAEDACQIVRDPLTASVTGAYVRPPWRRRGIGRLLLQVLVRWAAEDAGCTQVSVDFESANLLARAFWLKHFNPVCYSLLRHVDDRIAKPGQKQTTPSQAALLAPLDRP